MKKVVLLGDSIRLQGYGYRVPELLGPEYTVWQPDDNCRFVKYTMRMLYDYREQMKDADVIHWNCGCWDVCDILGDGKAFTSLDEYVDNVLRVTSLLQRITPAVIFATTVPARPECPGHSVERTKLYNDTVAAALQKQGVLINDMFTPLATDRYRYICEDTLHLSEEGVAVCAELTAAIIRQAAHDPALQKTATVTLGNGQDNPQYLL